MTDARSQREAVWQAMRNHLARQHPWTLQPYQRDAIAALTAPAMGEPNPCITIDQKTEQTTSELTYHVTRNQQRYRLTGFDLGYEPSRGGIIRLRGEAMPGIGEE